jgi:hypothetical protein
MWGNRSTQLGKAAMVMSHARRDYRERAGKPTSHTPSQVITFRARERAVQKIQRPVFPRAVSEENH